MNSMQSFSAARLIFIITVLIVFNSCEETSTIDIKLKHDQVLVCTGFIGHGVEPMVYLQVTHNPLTEPPDQRLDATVRMVKLGMNDEQLTELWDNFYTGGQKGIAGQSCSIVAESKLFGTVYSQQITVPESIPISNFNAEITNNGDVKINILFSDPEGKNYYALKVLYCNEEGISLNEDTENILIYPSQVFDDAMAVNGDIEQTLTLQKFNLQVDELGQVKIILYHIDTHTWYYYKSLHESEGSLGDIWLEPTIIYSNMYNGIGVFGGFATDTLTITKENLNLPEL